VWAISASGISATRPRARFCDFFAAQFKSRVSPSHAARISALEAKCLEGFFCVFCGKAPQTLSQTRPQCRRPRLLADEHTTPRMRNYHGRRARLSCRKPLFRTAQATVHGRLLVAIPDCQQQSIQLLPISSKPHLRAKVLTSPCIHHLWHWLPV